MDIIHSLYNSGKLEICRTNYMGLDTLSPTFPFKNSIAVSSADADADADSK